MWRSMDKVLERGIHKGRGSASGEINYIDVGPLIDRQGQRSSHVGSRLAEWYRSEPLCDAAERFLA